MIHVETTLQYNGITMRNPSKEFLGKFFDTMHDEFVKKAAIVHRKSVFQILIRIIRLCNVDTGRLRGSFTPIMDNAGFSTYQAFMTAPPLEGGKGPGHYDETAVQQGKAMGAFIDALFNTTITTNVTYASLVDQKSGFLTKALVWGDRQYNRNFERFFEASYKAGWIPEQFINSPEDEE